MTFFNPCPQPSLATSGFRSALLLPLGLLLLADTAWAQTGSSTERNPTVTFSSPGPKQVTLQACNAVGCSTVTRTVMVLDPRPQIASASIPAMVGVNQAVTLRATTTGRPPLNHQWVFSNGATNLVAGGNPATWTAPALPGTYQAHLGVTNADGSAATVPVTVNVVAATFADVPPTHWAWRFVENMYARGISFGCGSSPLLFCPENNVSRAEMAVFLLRAKEGAAYVPPACTTPRFADVPCSSPFAPWINELVARGVTAGCGGGNYCPTTAVTRDQMAVFLLVTKEGAGYSPDSTCLSAPFNDVPCYSPFARWIRELVTRGVTAGCGGGYYCPSTPVTRAQMSIFLSTIFNLPPP
ncbi:MAG TPA: S-layer homology domain-containing protein [Thermoanaerobaculia bacterium]|jgi:hypothetical protein